MRDDVRNGTVKVGAFKVDGMRVDVYDDGAVVFRRCWYEAGAVEAPTALGLDPASFWAHVATVGCWPKCRGHDGAPGECSCEGFVGVYPSDVDGEDARDAAQGHGEMMGANREVDWESPV